jgi:putative cell wall-binding protein
MPKLFKKNIISETYKFFKFKKGKTKTQSRVLAAEARETGNYPDEVLKIMKHNSDQIASLEKIKKVKKKVIPAPNISEGSQMGLFDKLG